ncbi:unnamed protein product [Trifolium pratense]|uniref:Uncharacterized protein n=1 Tax=Trifolium pratense TaxID=57577 RepID=A0ACB0JKQ9_TRIPR|nr:unnamed protein product [Trifolium pratense]
MSAATMLVINRSPSNFNLVAVGWQVYPTMYDDDKTHLFIAWGSDNLNKGCFNLQCQGFVQTDKSITPGQIFDQTSIISGITVEVPMAIFQVIFK